MKLFRLFVFVFFAIALYGSVDCMSDATRQAEHAGAWISMFICCIGCFVAAVGPSV